MNVVNFSNCLKSTIPASATKFFFLFPELVPCSTQSMNSQRLMRHTATLPLSPRWMHKATLRYIDNDILDLLLLFGWLSGSVILTAARSLSSPPSFLWRTSDFSAIFAPMIAADSSSQTLKLQFVHFTILHTHGLASYFCGTDLLKLPQTRADEQELGVRSRQPCNSCHPRCWASQTEVVCMPSDPPSFYQTCSFSAAIAETCAEAGIDMDAVSSVDSQVPAQHEGLWHAPCVISLSICIEGLGYGVCSVFVFSGSLVSHLAAFPFSNASHLA